LTCLDDIFGRRSIGLLSPNLADHTVAAIWFSDRYCRARKKIFHRYLSQTELYAPESPEKLNEHESPGGIAQRNHSTPVNRPLSMARLPLTNVPEICPICAFAVVEFTLEIQQKTSLHLR
jgi:hypothetical protein